MKPLLAARLRRKAKLELEPDQCQVRYGARRSQPGELSFKLLAVLAEHAPHTVGYDTIAQNVWGSEVTRETLKQRVKLLRDELREIGAPDSAIQAVRNTGYRFTLDVDNSPERRARHRWALVVAAILVTGATLLVWRGGNAGEVQSGELTIAVAIPEGEGSPTAARRSLRDRLIAELSALDEVRVIDDLLADTGSRGELVADIDLHQTPGDARLTVKLADNRSGIVLWAQTYRYEPDRVDAIMSHAANNIHAFSATLGGALGAGGYRAQTASVRDSYIRALRASRSGEEDRLLATRRRLRAILADAPDFLLARSLFHRVNADLVIRHGYAHLLAERGERTLERALRDHPDFADFHYSMARIQLALGHTERALEEVRRAQVSMPFLARDIQALEREIGMRSTPRPSPDL